MHAALRKFVDHAVEHSRLGADGFRRADAWAVELAAGDPPGHDRVGKCRRSRHGMSARRRVVFVVEVVGVAQALTVLSTFDDHAEDRELLFAGLQSSLGEEQS